MSNGCSACAKQGAMAMALLGWLMQSVLHTRPTTERRESLYDELEDTGEGSQGATVAAPAARKAFWGAPRAPMTLALSKDDGLTWPWQRNLEVGDGWCMSNDSEQGRNREYSYPSLRQDADGTLHLAYTVFRQHIRHVRLQPDWATQQP